METLNNNQQTTGLQTFYNDGINAGIRMKMIDGESWFIAKDICCALGLPICGRLLLRACGKGRSSHIIRIH